MSFETFIARRYFGSGRFFVSISTWITIMGVTLGVAAVCFVTAMHNGFEAEIRSRLLGTSSHISIFPYGQNFITDYDSLTAEVDKFPHVVAASPFIYYKAAISSSSAGDGIIVRGIEPEKERLTADVAHDIVAGTYTFDSAMVGDDTVPGIILGVGLADRLGVSIGDPVVLYSLKGEELRTNIRPRVAKFYVSGIFESGMYEFDGQMAYISLASAQDLFKLGKVATGVHLKLDDIYLAEKIAPKLDSALGLRYDVVPWNILHKNLFSWIAIEKLALSIGFSLIVIVAGFSIVSTLVMLTMEKRAEIGILKTMGATPAQIRKIFVYKGLAIATIGVLSGWVISYGLGFIQNKWKIVSLPPDIYFITYVPIDSHPVEYLAAGLVTYLICFFAALWPAHQAAQLSVVDVLRE